MEKEKAERIVKIIDWVRFIVLMLLLAVVFGAIA